MTERSTYVRKICDGRFEYGFVTYAKNYRKHSDKYEPHGVEATVAAAEQRMFALTGNTRATSQSETGE